MSEPAPRITLAVLAFRQSAFIDDAVRSALAQQCEPIEVLLSDDCSPDDTFDRMRALADAYRGPHRVTVRRNATNLGMGAHFNAVVAAARGSLIVLQAGDDLSLPQRVARVAEAWDAGGGRADLIASDVVDMAADGSDLGTLRVDDLAQWPDAAAWARRRPYIVGAAHAVTRRLSERFGPLDASVSHEDQANLLRAICAGGALTVHEPLVRYRRGGVSDRHGHAAVEVHLARLRWQNAKHLALHAQWLRDARTAGCEALVREAIADEHAREQAVAAMLAAPGGAARLGAALKPSLAPLGWRLRKCVQLSLPALTVRIRGWQAKRKTMRPGSSR